MKPTWQSLSPIIRGSEVSQGSTWDVVTSHREFITGATRRIVNRAHDVIARFNGKRDQAQEEALQWVVERLVRRVHNPPPGLPVSTRRDGSMGSAPKWFFTVVANLARDWVKSERRRYARETRIVEHKPPSTPPPTLWTSDALRKLERLLQRPERAGVPATHVLAYLCLYQPLAVDRSMVVRAHEYISAAGSRSGRKGLYRPLEETWHELQAWRARHADDPMTTAGRAELAWVLRSQDDLDPTTWRDRDRKSAKTATVTVGKWAIRCADVLTLPRR